jgi:putative transposase
MRIRKLNHSVYQVQYHIVWGTKYRRKVLKYYVRTELIRGIYKVLRQHPDWYLHQINTGDDHVHLRMEIPPKYTVTEVVQKLKSYTSVVLRKRFKFINQAFRKGNLWSVGYFVSTVGLNEDQIRKYIEKQSKWDEGIDLTSEFS